jgi:hypothetical protein
LVVVVEKRDEGMHKRRRDGDGKEEESAVIVDGDEQRV